MAITRKQICDDIMILHTRFMPSNEKRLDEDYVAFKVEQARITEIIKEYNVTETIDQNWLVDFGIYSLTKVNMADDPEIDFCECDIMKAEIPSTMNLTILGDGNLDLGLRIMSACGKTNYYPEAIDIWRHIPKEHVKSKFHYYQRFGNKIFVNKLVNNLRLFGIPETTEGLMIKKTLPVISGSIKTGVVYMVKGTSSVTYNSIIYLPNQTFTGLVGVTTFTATGNSQVFYNNFEVAMTDKDPYPVSAHMARNIVISILSTELQIEKQQVADVMDDSTDDGVKMG